MLGLHLWRRHARAATAARPVPTDERELALRILQEFREMPGLCLTLAQTARLCGADQGRTTRALESLVSAGTLWRDRLLYRLVRARRKCA